MSINQILYLLATLFFVLAGLNWQFTMAAVKTAIRWEFFGVACLVLALWVLK